MDRRIEFKYRKLHILLFAILGVAASSDFVFASDETETALWPPDVVADEARNNLISRRDALDALAQEIIASPYVWVGQSVPGRVQARRTGSESDDVESPDDSDAWSELLTAAGFRHAVRDGDEVHLTNITDDTVVLDGVDFHYMYIWSAEYSSRLCRPEYADFDCGVCRERLGDSWNILFTWAPTDRADWAVEDARQCLDKFISATSDGSISRIQD